MAHYEAEVARHAALEEGRLDRVEKAPALRIGDGVPFRAIFWQPWWPKR